MTNIYKKRDELLDYIDKNKSDYLKYIELLKKIKKDLAELDILSSFNHNLKDKSRNEIRRLIDKMINDLVEVKSKIKEYEVIEFEK